MTFPEINMEDWELIRSEAFFLKIPGTGIEVNAGQKHTYRRKSNMGGIFRQFLVQRDFYRQGITVMTWAIFEVIDRTVMRSSHVSKMLKDGKWVVGLMNRKVGALPVLNDPDGKLRGWNLQLETSPGKYEKIQVLKIPGVKK